MLRRFRRTLLFFVLSVSMLGCAEDTSDETTLEEVKASNAVLTAEGVDYDAVDAVEDAESNEKKEE